MTFEPQNQFEESLIEATVDPACRPQFYKDLVESDVFIIQEGPPPEKQGSVTLTEGYSLQIRHIEHNGKSYIPVFSSLQRLQAVIERESGYIALNALEFMKITAGSDLLLNPGSEYGKELTKEEIASIIDGTIWQPSERYVAEKDIQVTLGQPANYPRELVEVLIRFFKNTKQVKRAYLAHFYNPETDEKPHTLIALEVTENWDVVMASCGIIARDVPSPDPPVDFLQITGKGGLEDYFLRECKPFYEKKLFGMF
ncbi:MAG: enhanced serine sensitivity protein SseB [Syntrophorhabdus sp. PtaU1.Bin002]|nr:MAG: enhanced serine sensitivity protein SseB [Syntrophorhabdus sp. PtaU1.Bin002]